MLSAVGTTFEEVLRNSDGKVLRTLSFTEYMIVYDVTENANFEYYTNDYHSTSPYAYYLVDMNSV